MTFQQWQDFARNLHEREERLLTLIDKEIRDTARRAGIDPSIYPIHAHNALASLHTGHPWPEVDYSLVRRVKWLEQRMWAASRLFSKVIENAWQKVKRP